MPMMTAVFDVPTDAWELNPFDIDTPFGKAIIIAKGNLLEKNEQLREALEAMYEEFGTNFPAGERTAIDLTVAALNAE